MKKNVMSASVVILIFKVIGSLSNVRPPKSENPELSTSPTSGNLKISAPGAEKMGVTLKDYMAIVKGEENGEVALYAVKGNPGSEKGVVPVVKQVGSILSGKSGGTLLFSSENAYRELDGNDQENVVYSIGESEEGEFEGQVRTFFKLTKERTEAKAVRTPSEAKKNSADSEDQLEGQPSVE